MTSIHLKYSKESRARVMKVSKSSYLTIRYVTISVTVLNNGNCLLFRAQSQQWMQLNIVRNEKKAFSEFTEEGPNFMPTFKYKVGTNSYDTK